MIMIVRMVTMIMRMIVVMIVAAMAGTGIFFGRRDLQRAMMMKMEAANQQKHRDDSGHHPPGRIISRLTAVNRMRKQMENRNPQHQSADEADDGLHSSVRQVHQRRQPASTDGSSHDGCAIGNQ